MSLYLAYSKDMKSRQASSIFFVKEGSWYLYKDNRESSLAKVSQNVEKECHYPLDYAIDDDLDEIEIFYEGLKGNIPLEDLLTTLAKSLLSLDLSVGVVLDDPSVLSKNLPLIQSLGLSIPAERSRPRNFVTHCSKAPMRDVNLKKKATHTPYFGFQTTASFMNHVEYEGAAPTAKPSYKGVMQEESFHDKLLGYLIESKKENSEIYRKGGISKQVFSKIISSKDMIPTKGTLICLAIGLELTYRQTLDLLHSAGYTLSRSIVFDLIVSKNLQDGVHDLDRINMDLNEYGCPLLGWKPRED